VESVSPATSILVGWPGADWQPPDTIPPKLAAVVILRKKEPSTGKRATASLYFHAWEIASESHADWLVIDSTSRRRSLKAGWSDAQPAGFDPPALAFLGGQAVVLASTNANPLRLRPYRP